jgi:hypothetical protein
MSPDELALRLQRLLDRLVRRLRLGRAPARTTRRLLVVQIDGLSRAVLEQALAAGRMPFTRRLVERGGFRVVAMSVGLPSSTPAFQLAAMYGVRPDIPGFHYHDKRRRADVYFPRAGDAARVEATQAAGRLGIVQGGSTYGCVFAGGAANNLFSFARIWRPTGRGLLRAVAAGVVLAWVVVKATVVTAVALARAALRFVADPVGEGARGWKWLAIKIGISVWLRELFTLAASRDIYAGVHAVYVNYLDYDVLAHAYGPRHRRALRALGSIDRAIRQLWRACRRVPEHQYDLYVLSDHGVAPCTPYAALTGGVRLEQRLFEEFFDRAPEGAVADAPAAGARVASAIRGLRTGRAPGLFQRFVNYLERDFPWVLGEARTVRERNGVRVIAAGPNAFVYFLDTPEPLALEAIEARFPGLAEELSRGPGIGFVLARGAGGPVLVARGKRYGLRDLADGPLAGRADAARVADGVRDLMAMPSAGDLVIYGIDAREGHVSFIREVGAHAGPSPDELETFVVAPPGSALPPSIAHPIELYSHFVAYQPPVGRAR